MKRRRHRLKVTREGRYFVFMTIAIGLAAINTGNNLLYLLLGWLLSAIVASGVMSEWSLKKLAIRRKAPPRVFAKRPFLMEIAVENTKKRLSSYSVEVEDLVGGKPLDKKCYFLKIPPGRTQRTSYRHTFPKRGLYEYEGFRAGSKYPFSLFRKTRDAEAPDEVLVFPAVYPVPPASPRSRHLGDTSSMQMGRAGEFFGLREYRDGDDKHDIHWMSTARMGTMMVREYEQEAQRRAAIVVDNALPADPDEAQLDALEDAISLAASLANTYISLGYQVRMVARGQSLPFSGGAVHLTRILKMLALLPTVTSDEAFAGKVDPNLDSILVVPRGGGGPAPAGITHVMEAG